MLFWHTEGSLKNNQAGLKDLCYAEGMEDALMWKLDCTMGTLFTL